MNRPVKKTLFIVVIVLVCLYGIAGIPVSTSALMDNLHRNIRLGLDLRGGVSFILRVKLQDVPAAQHRDVVEQTRRVVERRINPFGLSETPVQSYGSRGNELLVQLPDVRDTARIRRLLESRTVLEWYAVQNGPYASAEEARAQYGGVLPLGTKLISTASVGKPETSQAWYLLAGPPVIKGTDLRDARVATSHL